MRDKFYEVGPIPVADIMLDVENVRYFDQVSTQDEVIQAMLNDKSAKLENLAHDIKELEGITPDPVVVVKDDDGRWVVVEGNRRVATLKILNNTQLIPQEFRKPFDQVKAEATNIPSAIMCLTTENQEAVWAYLDRRHKGGREGTGQVPWNAAHSAAHDVRSGKRSANELAFRAIDFAQKNGANIPTPYPRITTLQRLLQDPLIQEMLGIKWEQGEIKRVGDEAVVTAVLKAIVERFADKKAVVQSVFTHAKRDAFIKDFLVDLGVTIEQVEDTPVPLVTPVDPPANAPSKPTGVGGNTGGGGPRHLTHERQRLIPSNVKLKIPKDCSKEYNIYVELSRRVDVQKSPNAAAMLLRALLEFSTDRYYELHADCKKQSDMKGKISSILAHMTAAGVITGDRLMELQRLSNNSEFFSAKTLHSFVHSNKFNPAGESLCNFWDNIGDFVEACWN